MFTSAFPSLPQFFIFFNCYLSTVDSQCCVSFWFKLSDSVIYITECIHMCIYINIYILFHILSQYRLLPDTEYSFCAMQQVLVVYLFYIVLCICSLYSSPSILHQFLLKVHMKEIYEGKEKALSKNVPRDKMTGASG